MSPNGDGSKSDKHKIQIAIFGSCVSRDTCEYLPNADVRVYVARHSMVSILAPLGRELPEIELLQSQFQKKMVTADLHGEGAQRISAAATEIEIVLIDLVDERRGYWHFADGACVTNSLEFESCGGSEYARAQGARLVEFGTDEHFSQWSAGLDRLAEVLNKNGLMRKTVLMDIEWAPLTPNRNSRLATARFFIGQTIRRTRRRARGMMTELRRGRGIFASLRAAWKIPMTSAEKNYQKARQANRKYKRYQTYASQQIPHRIRRSSSELRLDPDHKWGAQPFHYRPDDYKSIAQEIVQFNDR